MGCDAEFLEATTALLKETFSDITDATSTYPPHSRLFNGGSSETTAANGGGRLLIARTPSDARSRTNGTLFARSRVAQKRRVGGRAARRARIPNRAPAPPRRVNYESTHDFRDLSRSRGTFPEQELLKIAAPLHQFYPITLNSRTRLFRIFLFINPSLSPPLP